MKYVLLLNRGNYLSPELISETNNRLEITCFNYPELPKKPAVPCYESGDFGILSRSRERHKSATRLGLKNSRTSKGQVFISTVLKNWTELAR